jgi:O-antigen/teichoic acid export membrane protein
MSRTSKGLKNSVVGSFFTILALALSFISRKYFLDYLGAEVLGLNTTATNLLQFLNIAELGIGAAVGFSLYKPLHDKDNETVNEIVYLQKYLYRRIAWIIIVGALILMAFFPLIFKKMELPLWYAYSSFLVLLLSAMLGYFVNYKQIVLVAAQMEYKIMFVTRTCTITKTIIQIIAISNFSNPYVWWVIIEGAFAIISSALIDTVTRRNFHFQRTESCTYRQLKEKYNTLLVKVKQIFFHKISAFALGQSSGLIIYAYVSLSMVAIYGNYNALVYCASSLMTTFFNGINASVGDLVAEGDKKRILSVFYEVFSTKFYFVVLICFGAFLYASPFINIWIGQQYLLSEETVFLIVLSYYISLTRTTVDSFLSAYGQFQDIWAPVVEATTNITASIALGYLWGLNGVLIGVLISVFLVIFLWKPFFLFTKGFKVNYMNYVKMYAKHIVALLIALKLWDWVVSLFPEFSVDSWIQLFVTALINVSIFGVLLFIVMLMLNCEIKYSLKRLYYSISKK